MAGKTIMQGSFVELSEHKNYLELVNLVSYYDYPNANGRQINYGKTEDEQAATLAKAQTLKLMPVKAYYCTNAKGEPTFGGHEASYDANGNLVFGTEKIGVHYEVYIKTANVTAADGTKRRLPCLYAKQRIWKDKPHMVAAIKRLYSLGKLNTSWEVQVSGYEFKNGIKYLNEYEFLGNAMLGFDDKRHPNHPAYGQDAKVISLATEEPEEENYELMIAEALAKDLLENPVAIAKQNENEVETMSDEMMIPENQETELSENEGGEPEVEAPVNPETTPEREGTTETSEEQPAEESSAAQGENPSEEPKVETSALTVHDIMRLVSEAYRKKVCGWAWCNFLFAEEHLAWMHGNDMLETEFDQVSYTVENDEVQINSIERVKITLPVRELSQRYDELVKKNEELTGEVSTLKEYKTKYEAIEQAEAKKQHDADVQALRTMIEESSCFTPEEISGMQPMIDNLQKLEIQAKIGERLMQQRKTAVESSAVEKSIEPLPKAGLEQVTAPTERDRANTMRNWLQN